MRNERTLISAMGKPAKFWLGLLVSLPIWAATPAEREYLVQQTLAREGALFVTYSISESGRVTLVFGTNEPDWRIQKAVQALQSRPEIPGVTWIKTDTDFCPIR